MRLLVMISYEIVTHNAQASLRLTSLCVVFIFHLCANVWSTALTVLSPILKKHGWVFLSAGKLPHGFPAFHLRVSCHRTVSSCICFSVCWKDKSQVDSCIWILFTKGKTASLSSCSAILEMFVILCKFLYLFVWIYLATSFFEQEVATQDNQYMILFISFLWHWVNYGSYDSRSDFHKRIWWHYASSESSLQHCLRGLLSGGADCSWWLQNVTS